MFFGVYPGLQLKAFPDNFFYILLHTVKQLTIDNAQLKSMHN